ncbi:hypothetical protein Pint_08404 [Pistacia integerrima]|uniref:Uncharacterized protein n=1 Tax=Pistacia integerrima TaxID=434235 RepID=A0ACC0XW00_9ROSI|nr:hypothetical protein Pint_08404 [Pistacia integerrima]
MAIIILRHRIAFLLTSSFDVLHEVDKLCYLLALTILLNSVQPVRSGHMGWNDNWRDEPIAIITSLCDWDEEAIKASHRVEKRSILGPVNQLKDQD